MKAIVIKSDKLYINSMGQLSFRPRINLSLELPIEGLALVPVARGRAVEIAVDPEPFTGPLPVCMERLAGSLN